jgi:SET domain-containing protein
MITETSDQRFCVRPSTIKNGGRGVFSRVGIAKGARLLVSGFLVRRGSLADRCTHYADPYKFRVGKDLLIPTGYGGLINHSIRPNLVKIVVGKKVFLQALRPIKAGEELFHQYGLNALQRFRRKPGHPKVPL